MTVNLHEGVDISLPEDYKQLLNRRSDQQSTEHGPNTGSSTTGVYLDILGSHKSKVNSNLPVARTSKSNPSGVYALLDFDKSQLLVHASSGTVENPLWACNSYKFDVSHSVDLSVHLYLRNALSPAGPGINQDICLGVARFSPRFEEGYASAEDLDMAGSTVGELYQEDTISHQKWLEVKYGTGKIRVSVDFSKTKTPLQQDFDLLMTLGCGSSGSVFESLKKDSRRLYALKTIQTIGVVPRGEVADVFEIAKRSILSQIRNPFLVPIKFVFQTPKSLFLASPFIHSEELIRLLFTEQCFDVERIRLYTAEILCALESLHDSGIIYGDLKPQNILLDYSGHVSICDFGLCKLNVSCISPYVAPEIKLGQAYTEVVDWWTLGILLAEMLTGFGPSWYDDNISGMDSKIESFYFPDPNVVPPLAQDISIKLFNRDPEQRLGAKGVAEIKAHPFFDNINWHRILEREYEPILKPNNSFMRTDIAYKDIDFLPMPDEETKKQSDRRMEQFRRLFVGCDQRAFRGLKEEGNSPNWSFIYSQPADF